MIGWRIGLWRVVGPVRRLVGRCIALRIAGSIRGRVAVVTAVAVGIITSGQEAERQHQQEVAHLTTPEAGLVMNGKKAKLWRRQPVRLSYAVTWVEAGSAALARRSTARQVASRRLL